MLDYQNFNTAIDGLKKFMKERGKLDAELKTGRPWNGVEQGKKASYGIPLGK